jgi:hypothetical protein
MQASPCSSLLFGIGVEDINSKSGDVIEPVLKPQWWVNCQPLAQEAIRVRPGCLSIVDSQMLFSAHGPASWSLLPSNQKTTGIDGLMGSKTGVSLGSYGGATGALPTLWI